MSFVFIVGGGGGAYRDMYVANGWSISGNVDKADLLQFTGGEDVTPRYYGHNAHPSTGNSVERDWEERVIFENHVGKKPMAGICRGGQFLNVMNGGTMIQHCDNHAIGGTHKLVDLDSDERIDVSSTHHQMMVASPAGMILAQANLSDTALWWDAPSQKFINLVDLVGEPDTEVVEYPTTRCLCFQPHPEFFDKDNRCQSYFFELIHELMEGEV